MLSLLDHGISRDGSSATHLLFSSMYLELHRLAKREFAKQSAPLSRSVTTLFHDTYLDLPTRTSLASPDRAQFISHAARVLRGLIIDDIRRRNASKPRGAHEIFSRDVDVAPHALDADELSAIADALDRLTHAEPSLAEVVDLKFFCGFSFAEIAAMRKLPQRTVQKRWEKARIYLRRYLTRQLPF